MTGWYSFRAATRAYFVFYQHRSFYVLWRPDISLPLAKKSMILIVHFAIPYDNELLYIRGYHPYPKRWKSQIVYIVYPLPLSFLGHCLDIWSYAEKNTMSKLRIGWKLGRFVSAVNGVHLSCDSCMFQWTLWIPQTMKRVPLHIFLSAYLKKKKI